jgi:hypothetical protein
MTGHKADLPAVTHASHNHHNAANLNQWDKVSNLYSPVHVPHLQRASASSAFARSFGNVAQLGPPPADVRGDAKPPPVSPRARHERAAAEKLIALHGCH